MPQVANEHRARGPSRRSFALSAGGFLLALLIGAIFWKISSSQIPPQLPQIDLSDADREVVGSIRDATDRVRAHPRSADAWGHLGDVCFTHDYPREADLCYEAAGRFAPHDPRWPYLRGLLREAESPVEAIPFYRRAGELSRRTDESWSTARFKTAELLLDRGELAEAAKILDIMPRQGVSGTRYQFDRGRLCAARGDWKGSLQIFDACLNSSQCRRRAALQSAPIAARLGDIKLADRLAEYAAKLPRDPPWPDSIADEVRALKASNVSRNSTADQLEAAGKLQEALQVRRQQVERAGDARSYAALGMLLDKLHHFDEAEAALRKATELDPGQAHYHFYLSTVLFDKAESRRATHQEDVETLALYEQALAAARRAIELRADHGVAWLYAGWALERLLRQDEAIDAFRHAVAWRPELADTQLALGRTLAAQGKIAEARTHLEAAVRVADPQDPRPREALAALAKEQQGAGE